MPPDDMNDEISAAFGTFDVPDEANDEDALVGRTRHLEISLDSVTVFVIVHGSHHLLSKSGIVRFGCTCSRRCLGIEDGVQMLILEHHEIFLARPSFLLNN